MARDGFHGPTQILEAQDGGFCQAMSDQFDLSVATAALGEAYHSCEVNIKPYACCASSHSAVDAVLELKKLGGFSPAEVDTVIVKTAKGVQVQCGFPYRAEGVVQAQMSLQYIVAVILLDGMALLEQFSDIRIVDPQVLNLAKRVQIVLDPDIDKVYPQRYANRVEVVLKDGRRFETRVDFAKGSTEHSLSFAEVALKFKSMTAQVLSAEAAECIINEVESLETKEDIRSLTKLLM
ncbi:hypothetical protein DSCW_00730 [Desulfosarcina widdelii]|uniref:MmgE/PrpD C-terminal domain-containing protein n=1 Tax=Desulfosarcina widdelii TaxID=947919 RepID=A0A5K7YTI7_9BACT|nr:hypothetical protein DSCW_00730 [Desulfosarcina widdelii]